MPIFASCLPRALLRQLTPPTVVTSGSRLLLGPSRAAFGRASPPVVLVVSAASFDGPDGKGWSRRPSSRKSLLSDLIQEIEPLDLNVIQRDVPSVTVDAMKRTISGMLGILPSDQFNVFVEALWDPLFKLFVSSMMTGYTLHNAEYRLSLEKNLEVLEEHKDEHSEKDEPKDVRCNDHDKTLDRTPVSLERSGKNELSSNSNKREGALLCEDADFEGLGELTSEAKEYIRVLKYQITSVEQDLHELKRKNTALQMQRFVGEEKNDLLDYLRSLQPDKVVELSEPTSHEVQEITHSVAHGLLATLSPKMHSKPQTCSDNSSSGTLTTGKDDCAELLENTSIHLQPLIAIQRDYLARLLFWCLLLGHYLRGLEHRLELSQLLTIATDAKTVGCDGESFG